MTIATPRHHTNRTNGNALTSGSLRVLHLYSGNLYGGIETLLVAIGHVGGNRSRVDHQFAVCFEGRLQDELAGAGARVHLLNQVRVRHPWSVLQGRQAVAGVVKREQIDVVVCHGVWTQALFGPAVRLAGARLVFWLHDVATGHHWLERWARRSPPDLAICNSRFTASTLDRLFPDAPRDVIYCPVAPPRQSKMPSRAAIRASLGVAPESVVIVQASRLEGWKGHLSLVQALARIRHNADWTCWVIGGIQRPHEARYLEEVKSVAAQAGVLDRIMFLGQRSDVPALLGAADIHCQPNSGPEPFGISFIEALYAGLPVVTTQIGGAREIVTSECGVLVPPGDVTALAAALDTLVGDRERRRRLGSAGPARALSLSDPHRRVEQLGKVLLSLDSGGRSR